MESQNNESKEQPESLNHHSIHPVVTGEPLFMRKAREKGLVSYDVLDGRKKAEIIQLRQDYRNIKRKYSKQNNKNIENFGQENTDAPKEYQGDTERKKTNISRSMAVKN